MPNEMNDHIPRITIPLSEHDELIKTKVKYALLCESLLEKLETPMVPFEMPTQIDMEKQEKCMKEIFGLLREYNADRFDRMYKKELERMEKLWTS